jgi:hypothetical protein
MKNWTDVQDGVVHAFHSGYWGDWAFNIGSVNQQVCCAVRVATFRGAPRYSRLRCAHLLPSQTGNVLFSQGGWQEARGSSSGGGYYVENLLAELDVAGEWYFSAANATLYVCINGTTPPSTPFIASQLDVLIELQVSTRNSLSCSRIPMFKM